MSNKPRFQDWSRDQLLKKIDRQECELSFFREFIRTRIGNVPDYIDDETLASHLNSGKKLNELAREIGISRTRIERRIPRLVGMGLIQQEKDNQ